MPNNHSISKIKWLFFALGVLLYINTIGFDYALDDKIVITENTYTKQGVSGIKDLLTSESMVGFFGVKKNLVAGGRYRPLPLVTHALEWHFFGKTPGISHLINALMYGCNLLLLFLLMHIWFTPDKKILPFFSIPVLASLLFAVHPLHVEVVANIKGRDDIMCAIGGIGALIFAFKYYDSGNLKQLIFGGIAFFFSLLSKEASVTFIAILPLSIWFFRNFDFKKTAIAAISLFVPFVIYFAIRHQVIGSGSAQIAKELMNNPFLNTSFGEQIATVFFTFLIYWKLLFIPHPLTHDYYPKQIPILDFSDGMVLFSILLHLVLVILTIRLALKKNILGFALAFFFLTFSIYTNIVFPIGTFMNDRFMYFPSIGFAIAIAYLIQRLYQAKGKLASALLILIIIPFSAKTITRNYVWKNDFTLAVNDVKISSMSAKNNMSAGLAYIDRSAEQKTEELKRADLLKALPFLQKSIEIYPTYMPPNLLMGNALSELGEYDNAFVYYKNCLNINPEYGYAINNLERLGDLAKRDKEFLMAERAYTHLLSYTKEPVKIYSKLGELVGKDMNDPNRAVSFINAGLEIDEKNTELLQKLGVIYAITGNPIKAIEVFETAYQLDTNNARILLNLGIAHGNLGNTALSQSYINKAIAKNPELGKQ